MSTHSRILVACGTALLAVGGLSVTVAQDSTMHMQTHVEHPAYSIEHMVEMAKTGADHEAIAMRFSDEASDLDKRASEHEKLAARYRAGMGVGPKTSGESLANHCDRLVKGLRASANEAREMARLHRDVAQHLAK